MRRNTISFPNRTFRYMLIECPKLFLFERPEAHTPDRLALESQTIITLAQMEREPHEQAL